MHVTSAFRLNCSDSFPRNTKSIDFFIFLFFYFFKKAKLVVPKISKLSKFLSKRTREKKKLMAVWSFYPDLSQNLQPQVSKVLSKFQNPYTLSCKNVRLPTTSSRLRLRHAATAWKSALWVDPLRCTSTTGLRHPVRRATASTAARADPLRPHGPALRRRALRSALRPQAPQGPALLRSSNRLPPICSGLLPVRFAGALGLPARYRSQRRRLLPDCRPGRQWPHRR